MYGIPGTTVHEAGDECPESLHHKNGCSYKGESILQLLPAGKRHHRHTPVCERGHQAPVPDEASGLPPALT